MSALTLTDRAKIAHWFDTAVLRPEHLPELDRAIDIFEANRSRYQAVASATGIPDYEIAILHIRECDGDFDKNLSNGDSLRAKTVHVPAGRPPQGTPPFTFEAAAIDALEFNGFQHRIGSDHTVANLLWVFEEYNGLGYHAMGVPSPYIWSYTDVYTSGYFTGDHHYDPDAVNKEPGCAALLLRMYERGLVALEGEPVNVRNHVGALRVPAFLLRGATWVGARAFATAFGGTVVPSPSGGSIAVRGAEGVSVSLAMETIDGVGYVCAADIARALTRHLTFVSSKMMLWVS